MASRFFFFSFIFSFIFFLVIVSTSHSLPFVFFHGLTGSCSSSESNHIISYLKESAGVEGQCIEIGNGSVDSIFMPVLDQIQIACDKVKKLEYLRGGFNIFAISQGTLIARGLIELCDGAPPIKNFISLAGPHAGVASVPYCEQIFSKCCPIVEILFDVAVYTDIVQNLTTAATYYKVPEQIEEYVKNSKFLPKLNNERPEERNVTYNDRFSSLNKLVLLMNEEDSLLTPRETAWFGYYRDGSTDRQVVPATETNLYKEDWIGLKRLNESGKVITRKVPGDHANLPDESMSNFVVPYLVDDAADLALTSAITTKLKLHNNKA